jgi:hypothetical protein
MGCSCGTNQMMRKRGQPLGWGGATKIPPAPFPAKLREATIGKACTDYERERAGARWFFSSLGTLGVNSRGWGKETRARTWTFTFTLISLHLTSQMRFSCCE